MIIWFPIDTRHCTTQTMLCKNVDNDIIRKEKEIGLHFTADMLFAYSEMRRVIFHHFEFQNTYNNNHHFQNNWKNSRLTTYHHGKASKIPSAESKEIMQPVQKYQQCLLSKLVQVGKTITTEYVLNQKHGPVFLQKFQNSTLHGFSSSNVALQRDEPINGNLPWPVSAPKDCMHTIDGQRFQEWAMRTRFCCIDLSYAEMTYILMMVKMKVKKYGENVIVNQIECIHPVVQYTIYYHQREGTMRKEGGYYKPNSLYPTTKFIQNIVVIGISTGYFGTMRFSFLSLLFLKHWRAVIRWTAWLIASC